MTPARADRLLALVLRFVGGLLVLALPAAFLPTPWMDAVHRHVLRLGPLPDGTIVQYLARTASVLYAVYGAVLLTLSTDVPRFRPVILACGVLNAGLATLALGIDVAVGMPWWWAAWEGPGILAAAAATVWLARRGAPTPVPRSAL